MKRRLTTKKILAATIGIGAVSYVIACSDSSTTGTTPPKDAGTDMNVSSGNLMAPKDATPDIGVSSGNLMAPIDSGFDATVDAGDASRDANDDGG